MFLTGLLLPDLTIMSNILSLGSVSSLFVCSIALCNKSHRSSSLWQPTSTSCPGMKCPRAYSGFLSSIGTAPFVFKRMLSIAVTPGMSLIFPYCCFLANWLLSLSLMRKLCNLHNHCTVAIVLKILYLKEPIFLKNPHCWTRTPNAHSTLIFNWEKKKLCTSFLLPPLQS